jgi:TolB-like protein/Flp pilus assembly protein TadD
LLRIYSRHQGVSAALSHAETLINLLKNELGAAPEPETTVLIEEIRRGVAASADQPQTIRPAAFAAASADMANIAPPPPLLPAEQSVSFLADDSRSPVSPRPGRPVTIPSPFWQRTLKKWPTAAALTFILLLAGSLGQDQLLSARPDPSIDISQTPILVLPFTSLTDGNEANATADGISNHLINALSVIGKFRVISGATSHQYRGRSKDIKAVSHELGIRYAVDGNIQLDGDKMRVSAELIDTLSSLQIWSDQFEGDSAQRFSTNEIVRGIARALQVNVIEVEGRNAAWQKPAKAGIGGLLATGWSSLVASGRETRLAEAKAAFDEALRRSPDDAGAMLGLAAYHLIAVSELAVATEPSLSEAEGLLDKVLQRRPGLSPVYFYRSVLQAFRGQPQLALKSVEHCLAINPSFAPGYAHMGAILTWLDRVDEAVDRIGYAIRLSPKDPSLSTWYILAGWAELQRGHDAAAFEWLFRSAALDPNGALLEGSLAVAYALAGDRPNAEQHAIRFRTLTPAVTEERRLDRFGAFIPSATQNRVADGARLAFAASK